MTTLKNIVEALNTLDEIDRMEARVGGWNISIWISGGMRRVDFEKSAVPTEEQEGVDDDLPVA